MSQRYVDGGGNIPIPTRELPENSAGTKMRKALEEIAAIGRKSYCDGGNAIRMGKIAEDALKQS